MQGRSKGNLKNVYPDYVAITFLIRPNLRPANLYRPLQKVDVTTKIGTTLN
jgi:hypothetical protein